MCVCVFGFCSMLNGEGSTTSKENGVMGVSRKVLGVFMEANDEFDKY